MERYGVGSISNAFLGYQLPPVAQEWWEILQCDRNASLETVKAQYIKLARLHHPDVNGGSDEQMKKINQAWLEEQAKLGN